MMRKGEVWLIRLDPTVGAEIKKTRPVIIVSSNEIGVLPLKVIVPLTNWRDHHAQAPWMVRIEPDAQNGLDKPSAADAFQVRCVAEGRFLRQLGTMSNHTMADLAEALAVVFEIET
jgi:mRNA interferase MazF